MYGNFSFTELTSTDTGLPNNPLTPNDLDNLAKLWRYLSSLREELGETIFVNSAYRTPQVNEQVGGAKCSNHIKGLAADIRTMPSSMDKLHSLLFHDKTVGILKEFIPHSTFYHFSL